MKLIISFLSYEKAKHCILLTLMLIFCNCSVLQSKYIEIEEEDGSCWTEFDVKLKSNELLPKGGIDSKNSQIHVKLVDSENKDTNKYFNADTGEHITFFITLDGKLIDYKLKFIKKSSLILPLKSGEYSMTITNNIENDSPNGWLNKDLGLLKISEGEAREITIELTDNEPCESYLVKRKVLRKEYKKRNEN